MTLAPTQIRQQVRAAADRGDGRIPAFCYPEGWLERIDAIRAGRVKPGDWKGKPKVARLRRCRHGLIRDQCICCG